MAINASIITDTAKDATQRTVVDYGAGVFAHTTQDWSRHNVVKVHTDPYTTGSGEKVAAQSLRLVATLDDGSAAGLDIALAVPINATGVSAVTNAPPVIVRQPADVTALPYATVQLQVGVISDTTVTYQWYKKDASATFVALTGQTASTVVIPNAQESDSGDYRVVATNANGSTTSTTANVMVSTAATGHIDNDSFFEQLPGVKLFKFLSDLF